MTNTEARTLITSTDELKRLEEIRKAAVWAWWSWAALDLDKFDTAHVALSQLDLHGDPDAAGHTIKCIQSYIIDIKNYLKEHKEDLGKALEKIRPFADIWPSAATKPRKK